MTDESRPCECGHDRGEHYFATECQTFGCDCLCFFAVPTDYERREEAAARLNAMAEHHRGEFGAMLRGIASWMTYVHCVDDNAEDEARATASACALLGVPDSAATVEASS